MRLVPEAGMKIELGGINKNAALGQMIIDALNKLFRSVVETGIPENAYEGGESLFRISVEGLGDGIKFELGILHFLFPFGVDVFLLSLLYIKPVPV